MDTLRIQVGCHTEVGNYRENNEDRVYSDPNMGLFIVADGMGGQLAGEKASQLAIDVVPNRLSMRLGAQPNGDKAIAEIIRLAVLDANQQIIDSAARHPECQSMGTTLVMALVRGSSVFIAGIGDSRAYHTHGKRIDQRTVDHSLAWALVEAGTISAKEAKDHRFRNILWKYLGSKDVGVGPDISVVEAAAGDRFVLASDGLTGSISDNDILQVVTSEPDAQKAAEKLVSLAIANDSRDNVSCITIYLN
jgi:serine/threonine protein phosphatase PrpC